MASVGLIIRRFQKGRSRPIEISDDQQLPSNLIKDKEQLMTKIKIVKSESLHCSEPPSPPPAVCQSDEIIIPIDSSDDMEVVDDPPRTSSEIKNEAE